MRRTLMAFGFAAAFAGDWFLAIRRCGVREPGFLCGIAAFGCAHLLWSAANWREAKVEWKALPVVLLPLLGFFVARVHGRIPETVFCAASVYALVSACSLAVAFGTRRWAYSLGISFLVLSDVFIACRWAKAPFWGSLVGPTYLAALALVAASLVCGMHERRFSCGKGNPLPVTLIGGLLSAGFFVWAMLVCPGGGYHPLFRMLSYLGRTEIKGVAYPLSHYLFCLGMSSGAAATLFFLPYFRSFAKGPLRQTAVGWGAAVCVGGLLMILFVPENVNVTWHNAGCHLASFGGAAIALALLDDPLGWLCGSALLMIVGVFAAFLLLDRIGILPFAPYVPSTQKLVICSFMAWQLVYALRWVRRQKRRSQTRTLRQERSAAWADYQR